MKHLWKKFLPIFSLVGIIIVLFPAATLAQPSQYPNPLGNVTSISDLIKRIIQQLLVVTIPLAGLGIIIAGLLYILAAVSGNPGRATKAKNIFFYVVIGCFLVIGALAVAEAIITFLEKLK